jgi:hypothetical protein
MENKEIKQESEKKTLFFFRRFKENDDFLKEKRIVKKLQYLEEDYFEEEEEKNDDDICDCIIVEYQKEWYLGYYIGDNQYRYYLIPEELREKEWKLLSVYYDIFEVGSYFTIDGNYFIKKPWKNRGYTSGFYLIEVDKKPEPHQVASSEELRYLWEIKNGIVNL